MVGKVQQGDIDQMGCIVLCLVYFLRVVDM
jgi:hypothetical protein